jgi:hypothetical protein
MRNLLRFLPALGFVALFWGCQQKESDPAPAVFKNQKAQVIGIDYSRCACCGGLWLKTEGKEYRFQMPEKSGLHLVDLVFPAAVKVDYQIDTTFCSAMNRIIVSKIELDQ